MLKKIQILSAMAHLKKFDVEQLARNAKVSRTLVTSTLDRCPQEWLVVLGGTGFDKVYQVSLVGLQSIEKELSRVSVVNASVLRRDEMIDQSIPLLAVEAKMAKMPRVNKEVAEALLKQIEGNLRWAVAKSKYSPDRVDNFE